MVGSIDEKFLNLPDEALILTLRNNQKYFCLNDKIGNLSTKFIFVANGLGDAEKIIRDNEKLVRARLSDIEFFITEDLKKPLITRLDDLKKIVFHQKLGSIFDRVNRLKSLTKFLTVFVPNSDLNFSDRITDLCKVVFTHSNKAKTRKQSPRFTSIICLWVRILNYQKPRLVSHFRSQTKLI